MLKINLIAIILAMTTASRCSESQSVQNPEIFSPEVRLAQTPLFCGADNHDRVEVKFSVFAGDHPLVLKKTEIRFSSDSRFNFVNSISARCYGSTGEPPGGAAFGSSENISGNTEISGLREMGTGVHFIKFSLNIPEKADLVSGFRITEIRLIFKNHEPVSLPVTGNFRFRPALKLRSAGQDNCNTYRIPGLVTTGYGTLIAVYDARYNNSKDLQEDIDIGMSRSTDGGQTWEPMKVIMDMGEYGGKPQRLNGCGDPCVLYDPGTHTIWVAALWMNGGDYTKMLWWTSQPGMKPEETGQFLLVKSTDDGLTWSQPINITGQIKDPAWQLLLQGPGRGITTRSGVLVFPAQFKTDLGVKAIDGGQYTSHSTIVYSSDHGHTWQIGTGARSNTTEAQVVELADGSLMLNMRDDRNRSDKGETNGRAVSVTKDWGKTWTVHPSSNSALPEPNCMASIISAEVTIAGKKQQVLFFSNPNSKTDRSQMTIKASLDEGLTWPEKFWTKLDSETGDGYSCLTMIDNQTIGILYEGKRELFFQKIAMADFFKDTEK